MNLWQRKLLAYLHDPPSKPLNIREHGEMAESLIRGAGFDDPAQVRWFFDKICDRTAAAADRLAFPKPKPGGLVCEFTGGPDSPFHHPLGGGAFSFDQPIIATEAEALIANAQPAYLDATRAAWSDEADLWRARFFLHWRLWRHSASVSRGRSQGDGRLAFLPADTRIPDHSTWNHCSLVSALQSCVEIHGEGDTAEIREFRPAFLLVQIGPVQEFIAQARTTRDLWSGSYLLSWLIAEGIKAVTDQVGPDCVLFPSLWAQPLFDFLHRDELFRIKTADGRDLWEEIKPSDEQILTPNLPNRFLALVPEARAKSLAEAAARAMRDALAEIGNACLDWLQDNKHPVDADPRVRWDQQLRQFLAVTWQTWPWETDVQKAVNDLATLPAGKASNDAGRAVHESLQAALDAARKGIARDDLDPRNYRHKNYRTNGAFRSEIVPDSDGLPQVDNVGFAWAAHYARTDFLLAARRNTREFDAWGDPKDPARLRGASRDGLSGKEEIIGTVDWQEGLANLPGHHFKAGELLGAMSIVKRLWHVAFLEPRPRCLRRERVRFDSVPAVAAASFVVRVIEKTAQGPARNIFTDDFAPKASEARDFFGGIADWLSCKEQQWLELTDASIFHLNEWDRTLREEEKRSGGPRLQAQEKLRAARDALARLLGQDGLNQRPSSYYAVLALDGDEMGKWVSGARSPKFREQLAKAAVEHFENAQAGASDPEVLRRLLDHPRHLSPSYHLQFSEALCNFSVHLAPAIVEFYDGQLIYSGGDDVLAMLPAANAVACALALRFAFRGEDALLDHLKRHAGTGKTPVLTARNGFISLDADWPDFTAHGRFVPRGVPLLVPGRATVSVGLAIGHMQEPLQDMIREAQAAEKRAKAAPEREVWDDALKGMKWKLNEGWGRDALAVTLFKRSGETIQWGARFGSPAFTLLDLLRKFYRAPLDQPNASRPISGKFPYRIAELLGRYDTHKPLTDDPQLREIAASELRWILQQQTWSNKQAEDADSDFRREPLEAACLAYVDHLRDFAWDRPKPDNTKERVQAARPLREFINLFALEAFIARTGE
jgi:CRISPR-associated protein Cmr2